MAAQAAPNVVRQYPLPNRDFTIEISSLQVAPTTNGVNTVKSPSTLKSSRAPNFSREGILGSAQKARNLSQSSENRPDNVNVSNGFQKAPSEESTNPLKRRNTDAGVDYPRRRATIAVCLGSGAVEKSGVVNLHADISLNSARYAARGSRGVTAQNQNASCAQSWVPSAYIASLVSSWMPATSSSSNASTG